MHTQPIQEQLSRPRIPSQSKLEAPPSRSSLPMLEHTLYTFVTVMRPAHRGSPRALAA